MKLQRNGTVDMFGKINNFFAEILLLTTSIKKKKREKEKSNTRKKNDKLEIQFVSVFMSI